MFERWEALLVIALATWRITSLTVNEDGPGAVFAKLRNIIGVRYDERSEAYGLNVVAQALTCVWCTSPYVALFLIVLWLIWPYLTVVLALPFALSAAAILIESNVSQRR